MGIDWWRLIGSLIQIVGILAFSGFAVDVVTSGAAGCGWCWLLMVGLCVSRSAVNVDEFTDNYSFIGGQGRGSGTG